MNRNHGAVDERNIKKHYMWSVSLSLSLSLFVPAVLQATHPKTTGMSCPLSETICWLFRISLEENYPRNWTHPPKQPRDQQGLHYHWCFQPFASIMLWNLRAVLRSDVLGQGIHQARGKGQVEAILCSMFALEQSTFRLHVTGCYRYVHSLDRTKKQVYNNTLYTYHI